MFKIEIHIDMKSDGDPMIINDRIHQALMTMASLHEPADPLQIATVKVSEIQTTLIPIVDGGFFTDTFSVR